MSTTRPNAHVDVLVAYATRRGATRGVAERICVRLHEAGLDDGLRGVEEVDELPAGSAVVLGSPVYDQRRPPEADAFGGRLGDNRDWDDIEAWADGIARSLLAHDAAEAHSCAW